MPNPTTVPRCPHCGQRLAGQGTQPPNKVARQAALEALLEFAAEYGRAPTAREIRRGYGLPCYRTVRLLFGSVAAWLASAGLKPRKVGDRLTRAMPKPRATPVTQPPPRRRPRQPRRFIYAPDFVLHFPAMRAELARLEASGGHFYVPRSGEEVAS